jgi:type I restriction enzyme R subunit
MDKKQLSERDICTSVITPALRQAGGWHELRQVREEVSFTKGRISLSDALISSRARLNRDITH